jgi:single-strand DNA-binding protein
MSAIITIQGNLTREPELLVGSDGMARCRLTVAVNRKVRSDSEGRPSEAVSFFTVVAFRELATNVCESLRRGSRVVVTGRFDQRTWENSKGEKQSSFELVADDIGASLRHVTGTLRKAAPQPELTIDLPPMPALASTS